MVTSAVDIWNLALSACQSRNRISELTETSREANVCRIWYDRVRRHVLRATMWGCATQSERLALLATRSSDALWDTDDPAPGFLYAYGAPANMLAPNYLHSFGFFKMQLYAGQNAIVTNEEQAILTYTVDQENVALWDEGLIDAVVSYLAFRIVGEVNGKLGLRDRLLEEGRTFVKEAQTMNANFQDEYWDEVPENVLMRGYTGSARNGRYFYPFVALSGVSA